MTIHRNIEAFRDHAPKGPLLALDLSKRRIGVAGSDPTRTLATPITTIQRKRLSADLESIARIASERAVTGIVLGYPINMDDTEGPACQATRQFARDLQTTLPLPILLHDERLSTFAAEESVRETGRRRPPREGLDAHAAAHILQTALDALRTQPH
jgi:putative holliday junction resolvase